MREVERSISGGSKAAHLDCVKAALNALTFDELRHFAADALARLDVGPRAVLEDMLLQRAARGSAGWKPVPPSTGCVEEVKAFTESASGDQSP